MSHIQAIEAVIEQGRKAFTDGKTAQHNPHVNNPEFAMHWKFGFDEASKAEPIEAKAKKEPKAKKEAKESESDTKEIESDTNDSEAKQSDTETEQPVDPEPKAE